MSFAQIALHSESTVEAISWRGVPWHTVRWSLIRGLGLAVGSLGALAVVAVPAAFVALQFIVLARAETILR
jgi:hypothetical protein